MICAILAQVMLAPAFPANAQLWEMLMVSGNRHGLNFVPLHWTSNLLCLQGSKESHTLLPPTPPTDNAFVSYFSHADFR